MDASEMQRRSSSALSSLLTTSETATLELSLEAKLLCAFVVLFLFLLFLITVLWDRYGKEIGELYTPGGRSSRGNVNGECYLVFCSRCAVDLIAVPIFAVAPNATGVNVNDVAEEYTVYQKLPTFFYEYTRKRR